MLLVDNNTAVVISTVSLGLRAKTKMSLPTLENYVCEKIVEFGETLSSYQHASCFNSHPISASHFVQTPPPPFQNCICKGVLVLVGKGCNWKQLCFHKYAYVHMFTKRNPLTVKENEWEWPGWYAVVLIPIAQNACWCLMRTMTLHEVEFR